MEPALTADNLGHKTWLASYLLACRLGDLPESHIPSSAETLVPLQVLELGSGTGLLGIAAAVLLPSTRTYLTDLPEIVENLERNVSANTALFNSSHLPTVGILDWSNPESQNDTGRYDIILASDPLYSPQHPAWLVQTIFQHLSKRKNAVVIIELPLRDPYLGEVEDMRHRLIEGGLTLVDSGEEIGREDWGGPNGSAGIDVRCWWGVWRWFPP